MEKKIPTRGTDGPDTPPYFSPPSQKKNTSLRRCCGVIKLSAAPFPRSRHSERSSSPPEAGPVSGTRLKRLLFESSQTLFFSSLRRARTEVSPNPSTLLETREEEKQTFFFRSLFGSARLTAARRDQSVSQTASCRAAAERQYQRRQGRIEGVKGPVGEESASKGRATSKKTVCLLFLFNFNIWKHSVTDHGSQLARG